VIRDSLAALSLANLCFLEVWFELLFMPESSTYYLGAPRQSGDYLATIVDVLLLTALLWAALQFFRRRGARGSRVETDLAFFVLLLLPLNALRLNVRLPFGAGRLWHRLTLLGLEQVAVGVALLGLLAVARWHRQLAHGTYVLLLTLSPFAFFNLARASAGALGFRPPDAFPRPALASPLPEPGPQGPRVVWLLFDELDESMIGARRPPGLLLPELDRLRGQACYATRALPPGGATLVSVPALLTGRPVAAARPQGPADLAVTFVGAAAPVPWGSQPNLFCRARDAGRSASLIGWYHPYCRLFASCLQECSFEPVYLSVVARDEREGLLGRMADQAWSILPINSRRLAIVSYHRILGLAKDAVRRKETGLVFVHFSVPHVPAIFDRTSGRLTLGRLSQLTGYVDNLALVDRALGELRASMEEAGVWERTAVLVTSDHAWRESWAFDGRRDREVPFILKLPGQDHAVAYPRPFNTLLSHDLVLALLQGEMRDPAEAVHWLDERATGAAP